MSDDSLSEQLKRTLIRGCDFAGRDVSHMIVDAIACDLHNEGYALEGNTAIADIRWLAQMMWAEDHPTARTATWPGSPRRSSPGPCG